MSPTGARVGPAGASPGCWWRAFLVGWLVLVAWAGLMGPSPLPARGASAEVWLAFARRVAGQDDLWAASPDGGLLYRLTATPDDERWPAWSPDGQRLAYAARRDRNWDLYLLDLRTGREERLTTNPHFDGWPAWSPDGRRLAFASMRAGDLDIFVLDLETGERLNLTPTSPAHDFAPAWRPDGQALAFVSTRNGTHDIFLADLETGRVQPLLTGPESFKRPAWLSDGRLALLVQRDRRTDVAVADPETGTWQALDGLGVAYDVTPSPDGRRLRWLEPRGKLTVLLESDTIRATWPHRVGWPFGERVRDLAWGVADGELVARQAARVPQSVRPRAAEVSESPQLVRLNDLRTGIPWLNNQVVPSFRALRDRVAEEVGYDFLGRLSEALRPVDFSSDGSDYVSWHKAGRAVDTLLDLGFDHGYPRLEIVREDRFGEVYWRVWLRCAAQDGSCGQPLTEPPWDLSYRARWIEAPGQGGHPRQFVPGYYVDFTQLAEDAGWERISSFEAPDFDWRTDKTALEFWHFQRTDGLTWWEAMQQVHTPEELAEWFGWNQVEDHEVPLWRVELKGIPFPPEYRATTVRLVAP